MITCKEIAELLLEFCEGELPKEHCDLICNHILLCGPCHNFMESYRVTVQICRKLPMAAVPQHLLDKVRAALKEQGEATF